MTFESIFDIGAYLGEFSAYWLRHGARQILAVEPNPFIAARLMHRFVDCSEVTVLNKAVSSRAGEAILHVETSDPALSTVSEEWMARSRFHRKLEWREKLSVGTVTIDQLVWSHGAPDLIKIDVEGFELPVISGMTRAWSKAVAFEWHEELLDDTLASIRWLSDLGYDRFGYIFEDSYGDQPSRLQPGPTLSEALEAMLDRNRKASWGMIWAYRGIEHGDQLKT